MYALIECRFQASWPIITYTVVYLGLLINGHKGTRNQRRNFKKIVYRKFKTIYPINLIDRIRTLICQNYDFVISFRKLIISCSF